MPPPAPTSLAPVRSAELAGWGANRRVRCDLVSPQRQEDVADALLPDGVAPRGLGRSYGDCAVLAGGRVLELVGLNRYLSFDEERGLLCCEAGVSLSGIIRDFGPRGWFPMVTPGTKFVTVGGCIANDVHGKAHHSQGCFSASVRAMTLLLASGEVVPLSPEDDAELFWATFGGMGLLGVVLTATLQLRKIETTWFRQSAFPVANLEEMLRVLEEQDRAYPYSVATLDVFATGAALGRGVVSVGDPLSRADLPAGKDPLKISGPPRLVVPFDLPEWILNRATMRVGNWMIQTILRRAGGPGHYEGFFYPLDMIGHWNRGYGRRGFTQYQFVIPFEDGLRQMTRILDVILQAGELPFLNVLKRFGKEGKGHLSFPKEGYTLAIDFPIRSGTPALLKRLDGLVLDAGGRIYLGKDAFVEAETFRRMYPRLDAWLAIKARVDPSGVFRSDLGKRVGLSP